MTYLQHVELHSQDACTCGTYISPMEIFNARYEAQVTLSASEIASERAWLTVNVVTDEMNF